MLMRDSGGAAGRGNFTSTTKQQLLPMAPTRHLQRDRESLGAREASLENSLGVQWKRLGWALGGKLNLGFGINLNTLGQRETVPASEGRKRGKKRGRERGQKWGCFWKQTPLGLVTGSLEAFLWGRYNTVCQRRRRH